MKKYSCIIIDDDEIDRLTALSFSKKFPVLDILGVFESAEDAIPFIEKEKIDILFLDIDMPGLNGISFRKKALEQNYRPLVVDGINKVLQGVTTLEEVNKKVILY